MSEVIFGYYKRSFEYVAPMSGDQTSSSAIIAGYLKFKVLRIKGGKDVGSHSPSTQGVSSRAREVRDTCMHIVDYYIHIIFHPPQPKAWKQYWFEFRVVNNTTKVVEYYDKKDQDKAKGIILLDLVVSVQLLVPHKKQQFMMECSDGQARIFETLTIEEAYAWVTAFNAVLFGKNMRGGKYTYTCGSGGEMEMRTCAMVLKADHGKHLMLQDV